MNARQRGASFLLALVLVGRAIDAFDVPWEQQEEQRSAWLETSGFLPAIPLEDSTAGREVLAAATSKTAETARPPSTPLPINDAGEQQLQALPGVGPVLAARIVAFRTEHGAFQDMASLRQVKGVGARMVERLAPLLRFD